jgi:S-formylglutathione hydrolase FrmB
MYEKKISHEYRELPGDHSWGYWDKQVQEILRIAGQRMPSVKLVKARGV